MFEKFCKTNNIKGITINLENETERVIAFSSIKLDFHSSIRSEIVVEKNKDRNMTVITFAIKSLNEEFDNLTLLKNSIGKNNKNNAEKILLKSKIMTALTSLLIDLSHL